MGWVAGADPDFGVDGWIAEHGDGPTYLTLRGTPTRAFGEQRDLAVELNRLRKAFVVIEVTPVGVDLVALVEPLAGGVGPFTVRQQRRRDEQEAQWAAEYEARDEAARANASGRDAEDHDVVSCVPLVEVDAGVAAVGVRDALELPCAGVGVHGSPRVVGSIDDTRVGAGGHRAARPNTAGVEGGVA